jgi:hypothetical protein
MYSKLFIEITQSVYFVVILIGIVRGGVQLEPLGTAATNRPTVPAPGDYDDWWNDWQGKLKYSEKTCEDFSNT